MSFFHWCSVGDVGVCKSIISGQDGLQIVNEKDEWSETPLHYAASNGCFEVCELLLRHGADVNARNKNGFTPLFEASARGLFKETACRYVKVCELLLAHGADCHSKICNFSWGIKSTPLDVAENMEIKDLLTKHITLLRRKELLFLCEFDF